MGNDGTKNSELERSAGFLSFLLSTCQVTPEGQVIETRRRVAEVSDVSIHIYPREHAPPHFHVKCSRGEATYTIESCALLAGGLPGREEGIVQSWYKSNSTRDILATVWNETRPGGCAVGRA
jgi:hypothetical protein